ncbi:MAG: hypothetical protein KBA81_00725 [Rhabdochlamydiaceae bacterium]|nr:hypothetical protein [Rhabdochlamydiaceae bacterium]
MSQITFAQTIDFRQRTPTIETLQKIVDQCSLQFSQSLKFAAGFGACAALTALRFNATPVRITFGVVSVMGLITSSMFSYQANKKHDSCELELNRLSQLRKTIKDLHEMNPQSKTTFESQKNIFRGILRQLFKAVDEGACTEEEAYAFIRSHVEKSTLQEPQNYLNYLCGLAELNEGFQEIIRISKSTEVVVHEALREKWRTDAVLLDEQKRDAWIRALYNQGSDYRRVLGFDNAEFEKICKNYCARLFKHRMDSHEPLYRLGDNHELCIYGGKILQYIPEDEETRTWIKRQFFEYIDAQVQNSSSRHFANISRAIGTLLIGCTLNESEIQEICVKAQLSALKKIFAQFLLGEHSYANIRMILIDFKEALEIAEKHFSEIEFSHLKEKLIIGLAMERFKRELGLSNDTINISKDHEYLGASILGEATTELQALAIQHQLANVNFLISYVDYQEVKYTSPFRFVNDPMGADTIYKACNVEFRGFVLSHKTVPVFGSMPVDVTPDQFKCSENYLPEELKTQLETIRDEIQKLDQANSKASQAVYEQLGEELENVTVSDELQRAGDAYNTELTFSMEWPDLFREYTSQHKEITSQITALKNRNTILRSEIPGLALDLTEEKRALKGKIETELKGNEKQIEELKVKNASVLAAIEAGDKRLKDKTLQAAYGAVKKLIDEHNKPLQEKYANADNADKKIAADTVEKTRALIATYRKTLEAYLSKPFNN